MVELTFHRKLYEDWKSIFDSMYAQEISTKEAAAKLTEFLKTQGISTRPNHKIINRSMFVYDKDAYSQRGVEKPLGLGIVYEKPNGKPTQDIYIVSPLGELDKFYSEKEVVRKYPAMKDTHKANLPV